MGESMGFTSAALTPDTTVTGLSGGERQGLAIVRALYFEADIIILDEPTMGLSLKETEKLLHFVAGIRAAGKSCHLHRPQHLPRLLGGGSHRAPRSRRVAGEFPTARYSLEELMGIMREVAVDGRFHADRSAIARTARRARPAAPGSSVSADATAPVGLATRRRALAGVRDRAGPRRSASRSRSCCSG